MPDFKPFARWFEQRMQAATLAVAKRGQLIIGNTAPIKTGFMRSPAPDGSTEIDRTELASGRTNVMVTAVYAPFVDDGAGGRKRGAGFSKRARDMLDAQASKVFRERLLAPFSAGGDGGESAASAGGLRGYR